MELVTEGTAIYRIHLRDFDTAVMAAMRALATIYNNGSVILTETPLYATFDLGHVMYDGVPKKDEEDG